MHYLIDPTALKNALSGLTSNEVDHFMQSALTDMQDGRIDKHAWITGAKKPKGSTGNYTPAFEQFWKAFPSQRRTAKGAAFASWSKLKVPEPELLRLCLAALKWQIHSKSWQEGYIPMPSTYLNQRRFDDEAPDDFSAPQCYQDQDGIWRTA